MNWELDFGGKLRRGVDQNKALADADRATLANTLLTEQVALATAVIGLRISDANIALLRTTVDNDRRYLEVIEHQDQAGTVQPSDVITARTQLEAAQASLVAAGMARARYEHAIAVLVGREPGALDLPATGTLPVLPDVPVGVPSTLLQRRPDIATAERQMAAQNEAIGIAIAAYYPSISLSAIDGFSQSPLSGLLHLANYVWSAGTSASETLFDGGLRRGHVVAARAAYDQTAATYAEWCCPPCRMSRTTCRICGFWASRPRFWRPM